MTVRTTYPFLVLVAGLVLAAVWSLATGPLSWQEVDATVAGLRLERLAAGLLAGAALAVSGTLMQGLFRNPLASPSVTGVTAGASLGALIMLLLWDSAPAAWAAAIPRTLWLPVGAFAGALAALATLQIVARRRGDLASVLLVGMVLAILFGAIAGFVLATGADRYGVGRAMLAFSLGSLDNASPAEISLTLPLVVIGIGFAWTWGRPLDLALSGETEAASLGLDVPQLRRWVLVWTAVLAASAVVLGGGIGFVCLVVPNALRLWLGPHHRPLVIGSALGGALFLTLADTCARRLAPVGGEVPLGVVTGLVGAPFFLWCFRRERAAGRM